MLSRKLERELPALRLNLDEWHIRLYGQDAEHPEHDVRHSIIEERLWEIGRRVLELGSDLILDYGLWAREERDDYRQRAKQLGAACRVHYLDVQEDELMRRLRQRNSRPPIDCFIIREEAMRPWIASFEAPTADELDGKE